MLLDMGRKAFVWDNVLWDYIGVSKKLSAALGPRSIWLDFTICYFVPIPNFLTVALKLKKYQATTVLSP